MSLISQPYIENDDTDWNSLKDEFILCLKKIKYKTNEVSDNDLGSIRVISGGSLYGEISELVFAPPRENIIEGWEIPGGVPERAIEIITFFLNSKHELPIEMREYLLAGLQSSISKDGMDLQDSFNLKPHNKSHEKKKLKSRIGMYIFYRRELNKAIKEIIDSGYTQAGPLNEMLYSEIKIIFNVCISDHKTLSRYETKKNGYISLYKSLPDMLKQNKNKTLMYMHCLKLELEKESNIAIKKFKSDVLECLKKSMLS